MENNMKVIANIHRDGDIFGSIQRVEKTIQELEELYKKDKTICVIEVITPC